MKRQTLRSISALWLIGPVLLVCWGCEELLDDGTPDVEVEKDPVVFGGDDRREYGDITSESVRLMANATAAIFDNTGFSWSGGTVRFNPLYGTFTEAETPTANSTNFNPPYSRPLCDDVPYRGQVRRAKCTAFLIGPDLFATAGHCLCDATGCSGNYLVVFGFDSEHVDADGYTSVPTSDVYVIDGTPVGVNNGDIDYAIFRVNRPVEGRTPLIPQYSGATTTRGDLVTIGYPDMIPQKIAGNATVRVDDPLDPVLFFTDLDAFGGNSGGPVIDALTGVVVGIHVKRPYEHYVDAPDGAGGLCAAVNVCSQAAGCTPNYGSPWAGETRMSFATAEAEVPLHPALVMNAVFN